MQVGDGLFQRGAAFDEGKLKCSLFLFGRLLYEKARIPCRPVFRAAV